MSTAEATAYYAGSEERAADRSGLWRLAERLTPKEGWDSFVLMLAAVGVAAFTVREGDWVDTPGLFAIVLWSALTGLILAKARAPWPLLHVAGLALGAVAVVWQGTMIVEGSSTADQVREIWSRLSAFYDAATAGGISTDLLPFSLLLLAMAWLLGYVGTFYLFRNTNVWVGLVLAAVAMMTNLSFLPDGYGTRFFAFILVALLLVARVTMLQRERRLVSARFGFMPGRRWLPLQVTTGLTVIVLAVAAFLPLISLVSDRAVEIWNFGRSPITNLEDEFARLFSGITTQKDVDGRFFGKVLPFQGKISFGGDIVMRATSRLPSYWLSRTYSEYTSKGWIAGESRRQQVGDEALPPPQESVSRLPTSQTVEVAFETDSLFTGGNLGWVSRPAVVETLAPMSFEIDLFDSSGDESFPEEIQGLARRLRDVDLRSPVAALGQISRIIPSDMVLTGPPPASVEEFGQALNKVVVERKGPLFPDVVMWRFQEPLAEADSYVLSSLVSFATDNDLREADGRYSGFIKDHYLQVPPSLPQRVRDLAADLTRGESTPLDKALAVQDYLRGGTFEYSQDISKPPKDADGVDYFLFETQEGYSDYYASAMTVMLRTVGVAARLAAGYAPGEPTGPQSRLREIKDSDSHGWTQVYFPGHGWLDFEPTPEWPVPDRSGAEGLTDAAVDPDSGDDCVETFGPLGDRALEECSDGSIVGDQAIIEEEDMLQPVAARQEFDEAANGTSRMFAGIGIGILAALLVLWLALWSAWTRGLSRATPAEKFYTKMSRLGTVAGLGRRPHQTPIEYATTLGASIPAIASHAETTAWAFASGQYAGPPSEAQSPDGVPELEQSWRRVRSGLLGRLLKRLVLMGGTNEGARSV